MYVLSNKINSLNYSATLEVADQMRRLIKLGKDVKSLSLGEPDFDTPENIKKAAAQAMAIGDTKYPPVTGTQALKEAIIKKFQHDNRLIYTPEQIIVCNGAKQALFNALLVLLNADDEVIVPIPYWVSYLDMIKFCEGKPVTLECDNQFRPILEKLEEKITYRTKVIILNSPSNPSGYCLTQDDLKFISEVMLRYPQITIITDDIYEHLIYDNQKFHTIAEVEPKLYDRTITINGVSKAYSMTGWRVGYAAGPIDIIKAMGKLQSQVTGGVCTIAQAAAVEALIGDQTIMLERVKLFEERRNLVFELLNQAPGLECKKPGGAFYAFPNCTKLIGKTTATNLTVNSDIEFAKYLLEEYLVAVTPGAAFGMPNFFRVSYAAVIEDLKEACHRIIEACSALK